ncbi:hypothetical protein BKA63DRAFT_514678 [Paraphoma chrysanthemicola]|nr:hypothetical protein BKA63DRAFT_514678 [Paraphoma chrysanthemicola]
MGDPFSVAGTAVGITSLGIQTCQIIHKFYAQHKGFHDDIDNLLRQVQGLKGILESLHHVKRRFELDNYEPSSQLHLELKACEEALSALEQMAHKCNTTKEAKGTKARLQNARKRTMWPYRKETLVEMQAVVTRVQDNLNLALQSAGLDAMIRRIDDLQPAITIIKNQTTNMERRMIQQAGGLESLCQNVTQAALVQHQHHDEVSSRFIDIHSQASSQHSELSNKLDRVLSSITTFADPASIPPSLLADSVKVLSTVQSQYKRSLLRRSQSQTQYVVEASRSTCRCREMTTRFTQRRQWISIFTEDVDQHRPDCSKSLRADYTRSVAAQFTVSCRLLSFCIQAGLQRSRRGGWNSIAPILRYRAVVSHESGAFKILYDAASITQRMLGQDDHQEKLARHLLNTSIELRGALATSAPRPDDVDIYGNGILHAVIRLIMSVFEHKIDVNDAIYRLLDVCGAEGVPYNQSDADDYTPIEYWQELTILNYPLESYAANKSVYQGVLQYFARASDSWAILESDDLPENSGLQVLYDSIANLLGIEDIATGLHEDDPLLLAILRRSEVDFRRCLTSHTAGSAIVAFGNSKYTSALASWPGGLRILTSVDFLAKLPTLTRELWLHALRLETPESLEVLAPCDICGTLDDWYIVSRIWCQAQQDRSPGPATQAQYAQVFDALALHLLPTRNGLESYTAEEDTSHGPFLYCTWQLTVLAADSAWRAGYRTVDIAQSDEDRSYLHHYATPLWHVSNRAMGWRQRKTKWPICRWLLDHGANATWPHPRYLTTPAHNLAREAMDETVRKGDDTHIDDVSCLLVLEERDNCTCHCSRHGCYVIGCAVSEHIQSPSFRVKPLQWQTYHRRLNQPFLFAMIDANREKPWMSTAVLRTLTFENLSLTHTCCYQIYDEMRERVTRATSEEIKVIHDLEREDIELLETLVAEFNAKWTAYNKPFVTFMNRVWKMKMRQIHQERQVDSHTYQNELRRMGVVLMDTDVEERNEDSDWPDEYESDDGGEGWYTTDEEGDGHDEVPEQENVEE